jgi:hypothetical protein
VAPRVSSCSFDLQQCVFLTETRSDVSIKGPFWDRPSACPCPSLGTTRRETADRANGQRHPPYLVFGGDELTSFRCVSLFSFALLLLQLDREVATILVAVNVIVTLAQAPQLAAATSSLRTVGKLGHCPAIATGIAKPAPELNATATFGLRRSSLQTISRRRNAFGAFDVFHAVFPILTTIVLGAMAFSLGHHLSTGQFWPSTPPLVVSGAMLI